MNDTMHRHIVPSAMSSWPIQTLIGNRFLREAKTEWNRCVYSATGRVRILEFGIGNGKFEEVGSTIGARDSSVSGSEEELVVGRSSFCLSLLVWLVTGSGRRDLPFLALANFNSLELSRFEEKNCVIVGQITRNLSI